ncbi:MAG: hypothetical protein AAF351_01115 [Pseudomonadota bacterium]
MVSRSFIAMFLSLPASIILIGVFLTATPTIPALRFPALLLVFPLWVAIASASYLIKGRIAMTAMLLSVSLVGFGAISLLKMSGLDGA